MKKLFDVLMLLIEQFVAIDIYSQLPCYKSVYVGISKKFTIRAEWKKIYVYHITDKHTLFGLGKNKGEMFIYWDGHRCDNKYEYYTCDLNLIKEFIIDMKIFLEEKEKTAKELIDYLKAFDLLKNKKGRKKD